MNATKKLAEEMRITPRTKISFGQGPWAFVVTEASRKAGTFLKYGEDTAFWSAVYNAANGINYALTGRVRAETTLHIREASAYQVVRLVAEMAASSVASVDAPAWLDARATQEDWK